MSELMAEALSFILRKIAFSLGEKVLESASSLVVEKASSVFASIEGSIKEIKFDFSLMQAYLSQTDEEEEEHTPLLVWLEQVREVVIEVEDIIDEYTYLTAQSNEGTSFAKRRFAEPKNAIAWYDIAERLDQIKPQIRNLTKTKETYGISMIQLEGPNSGKPNKPTMREHLSDVSYFNDEDEMIGNIDKTNTLIDWLKDEIESRVVISILGMGGLGKTHICNRVHKRPEIIKHFNSIIWITVSQSYQIEDLLKRILSEMVHEDLQNLEHRTLIEKIRNCLQNKRYLIFLDDMWDKGAWLSLNLACVNNKLGSRVVITTRNNDVARLADENRIIEPRALTQEEARVLFYKNAFFRAEEKEYQQSLLLWAENIVKKCCGLPLAIVAIGSLLSYKKEEWEWKSFYHQLSWQLKNSRELDWVINALKLSYNELPSDLKSCLLYCGLYPEDYLIRRKELIRLWIAEGFIEERGRETTMEEVAEGFLRELENRSLIQVETRNLFGRAKTFKIHDLVREMTLAISRKRRFGVLLDSIEGGIQIGETRRVFSTTSKLNSLTTEAYQKMRSFISVYTHWSCSSQITLSKFRLLRVLSLKYFTIRTELNAISELHNLHYLDLSYTSMDEIPKSFGKLKKLQTLALGHLPTTEVILPREIVMLDKLRHLLVADFRSYEVGAVVGDISRLKDLQTLNFVVCDRDLVPSLPKLEGLVTLSVITIESTCYPSLWTSLGSLRRLTSLYVTNNLDGNLDLEKFQPLLNLEVLHLIGQWKTPDFSYVFYSVRKLRKLSLKYSGLQMDPLYSISSMDNLIKLELVCAYDGEELTFRTDWFPKLGSLVLANMLHLSNIEIEEGTMKNLNFLQFFHIPNLKMVPKGIKYLQLLKQLDINFMAKEFMERLGGDGLESVQHIPIVATRSC